jgi:hypothetical protein
MQSIASLLLTYKVRPGPGARRSSIWPKLKGMGALCLQNGVCLPPRPTIMCAA